MKTVVVLMLLCLCDPGLSDCQNDCLSCTNILPKQINFNTVLCLIECEGNVSPSISWDFCHKALLSPTSFLGGSMRKRSEEEVDVLLPEEDGKMEEMQLPISLQTFDHVARALRVNDRNMGVKGSLLNTGYKSQNALSVEEEYDGEEAEQERGDVDVEAKGQGDEAVSISKRFGSFVKGRHGYRKLISPGKSYQKRYGGFIGIRKSARKWNNQKRFSEFLKQYLGMSTRATEFNSVAEDLTQQNEI
ncbi:prepronociceptin [Gouania willdenowi]|uniref:Prepronociceptin-like n=1 Tax=Gouania willdenowi TaxID=441366 RepID=A0A8C5DA94_GOUWI|nr:prepronociceptin-like [Gouania willdenowi]